jgi:hypothetical protein
MAGVTMQDMKLVEALNDLRRDLKSDIARHERETRKELREIRGVFLRYLFFLALALGGANVAEWWFK